MGVEAIRQCTAIRWKKIASATCLTRHFPVDLSPPDVEYTTRSEIPVSAVVIHHQHSEFRSGRRRTMSISASTSRSSGSDSAGDGSVRLSASYNSSRSNSDGDTCAYYGLEPGETCLQPRTCYDCLNVDVKNNPEGCLLSQFGVCESMVYYDPPWDYRTNGSNADSGSPIDFSGGLYHQFPAVNSTYCEDSDPACVTCNALARNYSAANSFMAMTTKFCVGDSGCVCILSCEKSVWEKRIVDYCESSGPPSSGSSSSSLGYTTSPTVIQSSTSSSYKYLFWLIAIPGLLLIGLAIVGQYFCRLRLLDDRRRRGLQISRRSPRDRLRLSAWRALNEELIEKEQGPGDSTPLHIDPLTGVQ